jgi:hypothetical protein
VVDRILEHVLDGVDVLLLRLDQHGVEAAPEDVVSAAVPLVECPCVGAVEVAHAARQVRLRGLDHQVVVVSHQALDVNAPLVAQLNPLQVMEEDDAVGVVRHDRGRVVPASRDVVEGAGGEHAVGAAHVADGSAGAALARPRARIRR